MRDNKEKKYVGPEISDVEEKMSKEEIRERFDEETAALYSDKDTDWLPDYDYIFTLVKKALEPHVGTDSKLIDLGAGTGNLARTIFAEYPQVEFDLVDFSEPMLNEVDNVLAEFKGNYRKVKGDIFSIDFSPGEYDAVVSSFAIHHGRGEEEYGQLYSRIYSWLADGGIFINCDPVAGDNNYLTKLNEQTWADYLQSAGFAEVDIKQMFNNYYREDSPISLNSHFRLLQKAEFKAIDVLWKKYNFAVYLGVK